MMCRSGFVGKLTAVLLSVLMVFTYSFGYMGTTFAGDTSTEKFYKDSSTGLTYLLDAENHTADLYDIDAGVTTVNVPEKITVPEGDENAGEYTVTEIIPKKNHSTGSYYKDVTTFTMPDTVKAVENIELRNVKDISFSAGVETIEGVTIGKTWGKEEAGDSAGSVTFRGDSLKTLANVTFNNTTTLELPESVTDIQGRFRAKYVTVLTIPGSVKTIDFQMQCNSLKKLIFAEGVTSIAQNTLLPYSDELTEIDLPESLTSISESWTFKGLESLTTIKIPSNTKLAADAIGTFSDCSSLESIDLPEGFLQDGKVPSYMFDGCTSLKSVNLGSTVTKVDKYAFRDCSSLSDISGLGKLTEIGVGSFKGTSSLTGEVDLSNIDSIPDNAFSGSGITGVIFSSELKSIGNSAFYGTKLTKVNLPDSVSKIGNYAFRSCSELTDVKIGNGVTKLTTGEFKECPKLENVEIGTRIREVSTDSFAGCSLKSMKIHSSRDEVSFEKDADGNYKDVGGLPYDQIEFTVADAVGEKDDTVTADGKTLQEAVNEAAETGEPVVLEKNVYLKETLSVPKGEKVTIKSADGGNYFIRQALDGAVLSGGKLIEVEDGGHLALENVRIRGNDVNVAQNSGLIDVAAGGTLDIGSGTVILDTLLTSSDSAVVRSAGTVNMTGGSIEYNAREVEVKGKYLQHTATVLLTSGATFNMSGGTIANNESRETNTVFESAAAKEQRANSAHTCTPGVMLSGGSSMNMSGGMISGNAGNCGSAIFAENGSVTISDGAEICKNTSSNIGYSKVTGDGTIEWSFAPGAVYISGSSSLVMNGGKLYENKSARTGGAIAINTGAHFEMNGGEIYGNRARTGGGIYTYSQDTNINSGKIYNNTATGCGGGVYLEGNNDEPGSYAIAKFAKTSVYDNQADELGGGYWGCPSASFVSKGGGCAVFDNETTDRTTGAAGDDYALNISDSVPMQIDGTNTISDRAPGGGKMTFAKDGGITIPAKPSRYVNPYGYSNGSARYDASSQTLDTVQNDKDHSHALKTLMDDQAKELAKEKSSVQIYGNSAQYGGGIGANGGVSFDGSSSKKILVTKKWEGNEEPSVDSVQVEIYADGKRIETVTLTAADGWKKLIEGLPDDTGTITAKEVPVDGYNSSVEVAADKDDTTLINVTVTNSKKPENPPETEKTQVSVEKVWENDTASDRPDSISVQLLRDGTAYGGTVSLSEDNDWSYTWSDLDASYDWSVEEVSVPDGYNSVTSHDGNSWTITNTKTNPETPDSENPRPVNPDDQTPTTPSGGNGRTITKKTVRKTEVRTPAGRFVRTGDTNDALIYTGIFAAAVAGAIYVSIRRRKKADEAGK